LTEKDYDAAIKVAQDYFIAGEPQLAALGFNKDEVAHLWSEMIPAIGPQALSVIAKDVKTGEVIGHRFAADWCTTPSVFPFPSPKGDAGRAIWTKGHSIWLANHPDLKPGECVHFLAVAVHSDWRRKGIATAMYEHCIQNARARGFKGFLAELTGHFSYAAVKSLGFTEAACVPYADFEFNGTRPFQSVKPPHVAFYMMEKWF